jgi:hypothetical protein
MPFFFISRFVVVFIVISNIVEQKLPWVYLFVISLSFMLRIAVLFIVVNNIVE